MRSLAISQSFNEKDKRKNNVKTARIYVQRGSLDIRFRLSSMDIEIFVYVYLTFLINKNNIYVE